MGRRTQIALFGALIALFALSMGAYALDRANVDEISDGVRIGHIDVGGLSSEEARNRIKRRLAEPLEKPVTVSFEGRRFTLSPERLELRADVDGMVDAAIDASRSGGLPARVWRYATGGSVDREISPRLAYSAEALDGFVSSVAQQIDREPQDATVSPSFDSLHTVPASNGLTLHTGTLRSKLEAAIQSPRRRTISAPVSHVEPEVTTDELAQEYPTYITIDRGSFTLRLWKNLELARTYTIAVGQAGYETETGVYHIESKQVNPTWYVPDAAWAGSLAGEVVPPGPDNPLQARWMGFFDGAGIHGTNELASLGTAASHGCIRMSIPDVIELYDQVPLGTPLYIGN